MLYLKASDYRIDSIYDRGLHILGKYFIRDEFLPNNLQLARRKCREYLEANLVCILVDFSDRFGIYCLNYEGHIDNSIPSKKIDLNLAENNSKKSDVSLEKLFKDNNLETFEDFSELVKKIGLNLAINLNTKSELRFYSLLPQKLIFDREIALQVLKKSLNYCLGPISEIIYQDAIEEIGKIENFEDLTAFFNRLADEIEDIKYRKQFQAIVAKNIVCDRNLALKIIRSSLKRTAALVGK